MAIQCRLIIQPENNAIDYVGDAGSTYETALVSIGINPDTVLIFRNSKSIPQDEIIKNKDEVEIIPTCSRG